MAIKSLCAADVGLPLFLIEDKDVCVLNVEKVSSFELSSHCRARQAIAFGLKMRSADAHVFVVGDDRSGRMTSTLDYLKSHVKQLPPPVDWVYLNNFISPHRPIPFRLPTGVGARLKAAMADFIHSVREVFQKTFMGPSFMNEINGLSLELQDDISKKVKRLQKIANEKGLDIQQENDQFIIVTLAPEKMAKIEQEETNKPAYTLQDVQEIRQSLAVITTDSQVKSMEINRQLRARRRQEAEFIIQPLIRLLAEEFAPYIKEWMDDLLTDILDHIDDFMMEDTENENPSEGDFFNRYGVNLIVDNRYAYNPAVILEPNPTYENLFGAIKYKSTAAGFATDFTLIRGGSLHRANGGILVVRAESIAANPELWNALKAAIRDKTIRIEERHRENSIPLLDAPEPKGIPLDLQIFMIGAPLWYYAFFYNDPDFKNYFKIKADIDPQLPANPQNVAIYARLISEMVMENEKKTVSKDAIQYLIGYSARWMSNREQLSSKFEIIADVAREASILALEDQSETIERNHVKTAICNRRIRNASLEDRAHRDLDEGLILLETTGKVTGQINALSVLSEGDHQFGLPNRITARTFVGDEGVINIERLTDLGGPIQQKGAFILDGFLNGLFAQNNPLSCTCSLTFEQNYGEIEGDSASLAELLAILSSLSNSPLRQDIGVTGSVNQFGFVQAVGGVHHKIEGFFRQCFSRGLTGTQGVIIPASNKKHVILHDHVVEAVQANMFFIWPVSTVAEALELLTGKKIGKQGRNGKFPKNTVFGAVEKTLAKYEQALTSQSFGGKKKG